MSTHTFTAPLWKWSARNEPGGWWFVSLPFEVADAVEGEAMPGAGFGSVPVEATVGSTTWRTSVFPSNEQKTYVLPIKKSVRTAEAIGEGDDVRVELRVAND
ncbi:DUF1905 domain-containing protein [Microbacterium sediminis]|uniref:Uncharacterized protein n=1 Tax=Microbacterium sediminis TaxID=904291 RepID=A0A1B9NI23_9MICO|nr:DUF1905 domain-containing protein [Microbacterium sediminis]OCG76233.1 hypothetical protein A7J15_12480 [Microbacterium sediminis]QBR73401.1 DUF1905 domain-containing protein [Microbacterium sediminis]